MIAPKNIDYLDIDSVREWITVVDQPDTPDNFAIEGRGVHNIDGMILKRDFGTQHRFANYPSLPSSITIIGGYTFYDVESAAEMEIVVGYDSQRKFRVFVNDSALASANVGTVNNWIELTRVFSAKVNGTPSTTTATVNIDTVVDAIGNAYTPSADEFNGMIAWNVTSGKNNFAHIKDSTATSLTADVYFGSDGLNWADNENILLIRDNGWMDQLFTSTPTDPPTNTTRNVDLDTQILARFNPVEAQTKVNMYWGSDNPVVMRTPLRLQRKNAARYLFYTAAGTPLVTLPANWYMEKGGGGLCTYHSTKGSALSPTATSPTSSDTASIQDATGNTFLKVGYTIDQGLLDYTGLRVVMTLVYDGYQESDPVYRWYLQSSVGASPVLSITSLKICLARMNKAITAIRFYSAQATNTEESAGWAEADSDYKFYFEFSLISNSITTRDGQTAAYSASATWATVPTDQYCYQMTSSVHYVAPTSPSIANTWNRSTDLVRSYLTPRYCARISRSQGALSIVDGDDQTLYLSLFDGWGNNNDDIFPELTTDNLGNRLQILLNGLGELQGIAVQNDIVYAFRKREYETYDLQSGLQGLRPCDFAGKNSLVITPKGLFWAGHSAIWWLPVSGGDPVPITQPFQNWYDGTLMINNGTGSSPYLTAAYRSAIVAGFDPTFQEVWFHVQANEDTEFGGSTEYLCLRWSLTSEKWLVPRELAISAAVKYFSQSRTDTNGSYLTVGYASGLLRYPAKSGNSYPYKDGVAYGDTGGTAITTRLMMNIGSIYGLAKNGVLALLIIDQVADISADSTQQFVIELFANNELVAFETKKQLLSLRSIPRAVPPRGQLERLRMRVSLPSTTTAGRWEISKITLGISRQGRIGNR
jgi:hypothetical protein